MDNGVKYFYLECHYVDFDCKEFGETSIEIAILKFLGTKMIDSLNAFPLEYHPNKIQVKVNLVKCGQKFVSLTGVYHRCGLFPRGQPQPHQAFYQSVGQTIFIRRGLDHFWEWWSSEEPIRSTQEQEQGSRRDDLILCSPTVLGFSYGNKLWGQLSSLLDYCWEVALGWYVT